MVNIFLFLIFRVLPVINVLCMEHIHSPTNITTILNDVLAPHKYDRKLRPGFGGKPVEVYTDIYLRSMGPVSERDMIYTIDIYFRQRWMDDRLATNVSIENLSVSIKMLERIWYPDTVFFNGRKSYLHLIPTPNRFIRIGRNGSVLFSQRLTVRAMCQMKLQNYPLDSQICPLQIGSFAYSENDVVYLWNFGTSNSVELAPDLRLSQFDLINHSAAYATILRKECIHSVLTVNFYLRRHTGFFMIHIVVPCSLLVILSWVSFWINREATADRIALGTTTVLTMTFLALDNRDDLPRVSYSTALDLYVAMCFLFVMCTLLQFAIVHRFTKLGHGDTMPIEREESSEDESRCKMPFQRNKAFRRVIRTNGATNCVSPTNRIFLSRGESRLRVWFSSLRCKGRALLRRKHVMEANSVSEIDKVSRIIFPISFIILNIAYWVFFLK